MLAFCMHIENCNNYINNLIFDLIKTNHVSFFKNAKGLSNGSGKLLSNKKYKTSDS